MDKNEDEVLKQVQVQCKSAQKVRHSYRIRVELGTFGVGADRNVLCVVMKCSSQHAIGISIE